MVKLNKWDVCLKLGEKGEELVRGRLQEFLIKANLKKMDYKLYPEIQLEGIDEIVSIEKPSIEIKTRSHTALKYNDILLELKTANKLGWFYSSKADYIAYVFFNKTEQDLVKGYAIAIQNPKLKDFIENNLNRYEHKSAFTERDGILWETENLAIPIEDFPVGTLFEFITSKGIRWGINRKLTNFVKNHDNMAWRLA